MGKLIATHWDFPFPNGTGKHPEKLGEKTDSHWVCKASLHQLISAPFCWKMLICVLLHAVWECIKLNTTTFQPCILHRGWCGTKHLSHPLGSCWWVPIEAALLNRDNCNGENSPMKVWGQSVQGRHERGGPSILLYWIQKPTIVTVGLCCFSVHGQGGCPFELFRKGDNGWMLRTYVERPLELMEE